MNSAHLHLILNHVPVFAAAFGTAMLAVAVLLRNTQYERLSLLVLVGGAVAATLAYLTGEPAERVLGAVAAAPERLIEPHEEAAAIALTTSVLAGMGALIGLLGRGRVREVTHRTIVVGVLLIGAASTAGMAWTAYLGGQIRHSEIGSAAVATEQPRSEAGR